MVSVSAYRTRTDVSTTTPSPLSPRSQVLPVPDLDHDVPHAAGVVDRRQEVPRLDQPGLPPLRAGLVDLGLERPADDRRDLAAAHAGQAGPQGVVLDRLEQRAPGERLPPPP